jgi:hypothetical protein
VESFTFLYSARAWVVALAMFVLLSSAAEIAFRLGRHGDAPARARRKEHVGAAQSAVAAILGLLLAFTFSMAVSRFETRKLAVVDEANAIGTAYLRASLLPEAQRTQVEADFGRYVDVRLQLARPDWFTDAGASLRQEATSLQRDLWAAGVAAAQLDQRAVTTGLYVQAVNEFIDSAGRRDAGLRNHVPESVLFMILVVCILAVAIMGYTSGLGEGRSLVAALLVSVVIAAVIFVILDLDRPYRGLITVSQQSMVDLRAAISEGLPLP